MRSKSSYLSFTDWCRTTWLICCAEEGALFPPMSSWFAVNSECWRFAVFSEATKKLLLTSSSRGRNTTSSKLRSVITRRALFIRLKPLLLFNDSQGPVLSFPKFLVIIGIRSDIIVFILMNWGPPCWGVILDTNELAAFRQFCTNVIN